jgi:soluble lytic murein transglycosylase-like protein
MKQLLQLQMLQSSDSLMGSSSGLGSTSSTDFTELLQMLLSDSTEAAASDNIIPASELLARSKWSSSFYNMQPAEAMKEYAVPADYEDLIQDASRRNGVDSSLVKAVIQAESGFDSQAVSKAGAKGLMQLMDKTGQGLGVSNPFDPEQNIEGGTRFLSNLLQKYNGNEAVALAAYNAGPGRVDRLAIRNDAELENKLSQLPKETQKYISKVLGLKEQFEA